MLNLDYTTLQLLVFEIFCGYTNLSSFCTLINQKIGNDGFLEVDFSGFGLFCFVTLLVFVDGFDYANVSHISYLESYEVSNAPQPHMVPITLIHGADAKGAGKWKFSSIFYLFFYDGLLFFSIIYWNFVWCIKSFLLFHVFDLIKSLDLCCMSKQFLQFVQLDWCVLFEKRDIYCLG